MWTGIAWSLENGRNVANGIVRSPRRTIDFVSCKRTLGSVPARLEQKRFLRKREYWVDEAGVNIRHSNGLSTHKYHVYFEDIPPRAEEGTASLPKALVFLIAFLLFAGSCVPVAISTRDMFYWGVVGFWLVLATFVGAIFFISRVRYMRFFSPRGAGFWLYSAIPSAGAVETFVREMLDSRNRYLCEKYGRFDGPEAPEEKLKRLDLLRHQEAVSAEEYERLRSEIIGAPPGPRGFGRP